MARLDLIFDSHSKLKTLIEVYAATDSEAKFVEDFIAVW